jgi:hypothetical protein
MSRNRVGPQAPAVSSVSWHDRPAAAACTELDSTAAGLTQAEARVRLERHGPNALPAPRPPGWLEIGMR